MKVLHKRFKAPSDLPSSTQQKSKVLYPVSQNEPKLVGEEAKVIEEVQNEENEFDEEMVPTARRNIDSYKNIQNLNATEITEEID